MGARSTGSRGMKRLLQQLQERHGIRLILGRDDDRSCSMIVTADHGGHDMNHGSADPRDVMIPWIASGQGVKPWLLAVDRPADWAGQPVIDAFTPAPVVAAGG
jgi:hypothetical protein